MVIGVGINVPFDFRGCTCALVKLSHSQSHFYLAVSGDGCALFHLNIYGFLLIFKDFMVGNIYI